MNVWLVGIKAFLPKGKDSLNRKYIPNKNPKKEKL